MSNIKIVERIDFEQVDAVFDALNFAFYPDGFDDRWKALWILFLNSVGWTEDEYWEALEENKERGVCDSCKAKTEESTAISSSENKLKLN